MARTDGFVLADSEEAGDCGRGQGFIAARQIGDDFFAGDVGVAGKEILLHFKGQATRVVSWGFVDAGFDALEERDTDAFVDEKQLFR